MLKIGEQDAVNILRFFDDLPDLRSEVNRLHRLGDVIVIVICAVMANADGPTAIAKWAKLNKVWLRRHLALPNGIPGKDTFRRVLGLLRPAAFQECFQRWLESLSLSGDDESSNKRHVAIDGKALRRSHDTRNGLGAMHIVSAWASNHGITLGQVATEEKSNEIAAIPELLEIIDVEDAIVTIDAAGCQKNIAAQIVDGKGDYVLALKGNQGTLFDDVQLQLGCYIRDGHADCPVSQYVEAEEGHGRVEERRYDQMTAPSWAVRAHPSRTDGVERPEDHRRSRSDLRRTRRPEVGHALLREQPAPKRQAIRECRQEPLEHRKHAALVPGHDVPGRRKQGSRQDVLHSTLTANGRSPRTCPGYVASR